jgi:hypothetical protein
LCRTTAQEGEPDFHDVATAAVNEVFPLDDIKIEFFRAAGAVVHQ